MRLKIGNLKNKGGIFGIRCVVFYPVNPFRQLVKALSAFFSYKRLGLIRFLRLPGVRVTIVKNKK